MQQQNQQQQQQQQQHQQQQQQFDKVRSASLPQLRQDPLVHANSVQRAADMEREQRLFQQQERQQEEWQRKEAAFKAELSLAQTTNAKLLEQVGSPACLDVMLCTPAEMQSWLWCASTVCIPTAAAAQYQRESGQL